MRSRVRFGIALAANVGAAGVSLAGSAWLWARASESIAQPPIAPALPPVVGEVSVPLVVDPHPQPPSPLRPGAASRTRPAAEGRKKEQPRRVVVKVGFAARPSAPLRPARSASGPQTQAPARRQRRKTAPAKPTPTRPQPTPPRVTNPSPPPAQPQPAFPPDDDDDDEGGYEGDRAEDEEEEEEDVGDEDESEAGEDDDDGDDDDDNGDDDDD